MTLSQVTNRTAAVGTMLYHLSQNSKPEPRAGDRAGTGAIVEIVGAVSPAQPSGKSMPSDTDGMELEIADSIACSLSDPYRPLPSLRPP